MSYWINRTLCDVLEEMRKCNKNRDYSSFLELIKEAEYFSIRMIKGLYGEKSK